MTDKEQSRADEQEKVEESEKKEVEEKTEKKEEQKESAESQIDAKFKEIEERYKKQLDGLNRRNSELENTLTEMKKEKMSEKEKAQFELEEARKERERIEAEAKQYRVGLLKAQAINDAELTSEAAEFITAEDEEGIKEQIARFKDFLDKNFKNREEYLSKFGSGKAPKTGESVKPGLLELEDDQISGLQDEEFEKKYNELLKRHKK